MKKTPSTTAFRPYRGEWTLDDGRRFFARPDLAVHARLVSERTDGPLRWREVTFPVHDGVEAVATVVSPGGPIDRGVVLAHGGSDDGRRFLYAEAAELAAQGAAVILPATWNRPDAGIDVFAGDIRTAVLIQRAALDVLISVGAPAGELVYLGHSAGAAQGAILTAVEPRLTRIGIFSYGMGSLNRMARAEYAGRGQEFPEDWAAAALWLDPGKFVRVERQAVLFVQHGRRDDTVPIEEARALFDAATPPKVWAEYDWDHGLDADPQARRDRAAFVRSGGTSWSGPAAR